MGYPQRAQITADGDGEVSFGLMQTGLPRQGAPPPTHRANGAHYVSPGQPAWVSAIKKSIRGLKARASGKTPIPLRERQRGKGTEANEENKELYGLRYLGWLLQCGAAPFSHRANGAH